MSERPDHSVDTRISKMLGPTNLQGDDSPPKQNEVEALTAEHTKSLSEVEEELE